MFFYLTLLAVVKFFIPILAIFLFFCANKAYESSSYLITNDKETLNPKIAGITLGLHSLDYTFDYKNMLTEIKETGAPWVCLTFKFYQNNIHSTNIEIPDTNSVYWQRIEQTTRQAKALGFKVALLPIVLLKEAKHKEWRGNIKPKPVETWFNNYEQLILQVSQLAENETVDLLFAGSEFSSLQGYKTEWSNLIQNMRTEYSGLITYSVNWDAFDDIGFADALDIVGVNGYFSLSLVNNPKVSLLVKKWNSIKKRLLRKQQAINRPIFFSEIGYASQNGNNKDPWNYLISDEVDLQEQLDCFTAFNEVWLNNDALSGVFFYEWFGSGGECDTGYTPRKKPALQAIKKWFDPHQN